MNNARKSVNVYLKQQLAVSLPTFTVMTGDEVDATVKAPTIGTRWLDGAQQGLLAESRSRLLQIEVFVGISDKGNSQTSLAEDACERVLDALKLRIGSSPKGVIPKLDYSAGMPGVPLGTNIIFSLQVGKGWTALEPPQQKARLYVLTVEVDYEPG